MPISRRQKQHKEVVYDGRKEGRKDGKDGRRKWYMTEQRKEGKERKGKERKGKERKEGRKEVLQQERKGRKERKETNERTISPYSSTRKWYTTEGRKEGGHWKNKMDI
jgi:hypothetical protein